MAWEVLFLPASTSTVIPPALLQRDVFDQAVATFKRLQILSADILSSQAVLASTCDEDVYKLNGAEYQKKLTKQFSGISSRLFSQEDTQLIGNLRLCTSYSEAVSLTERLAYCQGQISEYDELEVTVKNSIGPAYQGLHTDWTIIPSQMDALRSIYNAAKAA